MGSSVNLSGFCEVQKIVWEGYTKGIVNLSCKKCSEKKLRMTHKWVAICDGCQTKYTIPKPKNFPNNMDNTRNWKMKCDECGGVMQFHKGGVCGAYICNRCNNVYEV